MQGVIIMNDNEDYESLAQLVYTNFYESDDLKSLRDYTDYFEGELMIGQGESITDLDSLIMALDADISDLIHNGNTVDLISPNSHEEWDLMPENEFDIMIDEYNEQLMHDDFLKALATIILAQIEKGN